MALLRNVLRGRSGSLSVPAGASFTALNLDLIAPAEGGLTSLGKLATVGAAGPVSVVSVNGAAGNVGTPVPGSAGGRVTISADASLSFNPNGNFDGLEPGESEATLITAELSDGTDIDDAIITLRVTAESLPVINPPGAISTLTALASGSDVALDWSAPASNGAAITDYRLRHRQVGVSTWTVIADGVSNQTQGQMLGLADGGYEFSVLAINSAGTGPISNIATVHIVSGAVPVNQSLPQLLGTPELGQTLTYAAGTWTDADSVAANLLRDGVPVSGFNGSNHVVASIDAGARLEIRETASNAIGTAEALSASLIVPAPFGPLPGVLEAPNVIILGASLMVDAFANVPEDSIAYAEAMGFTGSLQPRGVNGHDSADTRADLTAAQAEFSATQGQNFYIVHTGGNNVTAGRPYPGGAAALESNLTALFDDIAASGDQGVLSTLTKRYYTAAPQVVAGNPSTDQNGSLPYVENVYRPVIETRIPDWFDQGEPVVDLYGLTEQYPEILKPDGIHPWPDGERMMHQYMLSRIAARAKGLRNESRTGRSLIWDFGDASDLPYMPGQINRLRMNEESETLPIGNVGFGALDRTGEIDHFAEVVIEGFRGINRQGLGPAAFAKVADQRLNDFEMLEDSLFVGTISGATVNSGTLIFRNLIPGDQAVITVAASRNASDQNRRGDVTIAGQTQILDASNDASANQVVFGPVTVPGSGEIAIQLDKRADSNFGYIGGVAIDFIDPVRAFTQLEPVLKGTGAVGGTLTRLPGQFFGADTVSVELLRNGSPVSGFAGTSYTVQSGDAGAIFQIRETATRGGLTTIALSNPIAAVAAPADPEAGLTLTASFPEGELTNSAFNRSEPAVFAADLILPDRPDGLVFELGAEVNGTLLSFRPDGSLLLRFGDGSQHTPQGTHAFLQVPTEQIPSGPVTLVWQIDNGTGTLSAWIDGVELTGTSRETPRTEWAGLNAGGYGQTGGGLVPLEAFTGTFNGSFASDLRYYGDQTV
ncbi:MAG: fibronectin type III domain-containing protein [Pseudomonadota bacterium]